MSIQRWKPTDAALIVAGADVEYVTYADHVAAVAAAEQRGAIAGVQEMAAVRPFKATDLFGIDPDFVAAPSDYEQGFAAAVGKCRDAVAALPAYYAIEECQGNPLEKGDPEDPDPWKQGHLIERDDVLDAIDGVGKP